METNEDKRTGYPRQFGRAFGVILGIVTCVFVWILLHYKKVTMLMGGKLLFISLLLLGLFLTGLQFVEKRSRRSVSYGLIFSVCYVFAFLCVVLGQFHEIYGLWMIGGWIVSIVLNSFLGMVFQTLFCLVYAWLGQESISQFSLLFLVSVGMCFLVPYMRKVSNMGYVVLIGLICNGISIVLRQNFQWDQVMQLESLWWELSCFFALLVSAFGAWFLVGITKYGNMSFVKTGIQELFSSEEALWEEGTIVKLGDLAEKHQNRSEQSMESFIQRDSFWLKQLREKLPDVYAHSLQVAGIAKEAADCINADQKVCYAGGLYHEIGKLESEDYVNAGILLAKTNHFPQKLLTVIEEHNVRSKNATSKEAAVVMLSDSVVSMLERVDKTKSKEQQKEMVKRIFVLRLEQGALDQCGLQMEELKKLLCVFLDWVEKRT